jgi:hypothetical protein
MDPWKQCLVAPYAAPTCVTGSGSGSAQYHIDGRKRYFCGQVVSHDGSWVGYLKINIFRVEYVSDFGAGTFAFLKF